MDKLSNYVVLTVQDDKEMLFDLTQKKYLPSSSSRETLAANFFLAGQEQGAVYQTLFSLPKNLVLTIIPTWDCNLRCTHCCVYDRLGSMVNENGIDVDLLIDFIKRYEEKYNPNAIQLRFCGGEPFLRPDKIMEIIQAVKKNTKTKIKINVTTNLTMDIDAKMLKILKEFNIIGVSLDGTEETHNQQRILLEPQSWTPYQQVISNIKKLMLAGFRDKIFVQASMLERDTEIIKQYLGTLMRLGVNIKSIRFGAITPAPHIPNPGKYYLNVKLKLFPSPCCKYKYMGQFVLSPDNKLYTDFYCHEEIGPINSDLDEIERCFKKSILSTMPVLLDPVCQKCTAIGYCWGSCSHNIFYYGNCPSAVCNRENLTKWVYINKGSKVCR